MGVKCPKCDFENPDDLSFCGKCGTQLPSPEKVEVTETLETPKEELTTGSTFAERYQIIEELGKGGMGSVYKVHDTKIKEKIALKLIKHEIAKDKKTIERFSNELRLARKIRHKNVCGMFDLGEERGTHYITMEFVPGEDLRSSIRRFGQLPIGKSISIANQICEGLVEAHRLGVVHRDLKSNNIMIDKEGNVRIMDFGIARSLEAKGITGAGVMIGTPEYMSPEQVEGKEVDQRSDIYSLGVILYEMMTGRVPFEGDTPFTIGMKHKGEIPKNPKEFNAQIPEDLSSVIMRCLEKDKEKRYQSSGEVRSELENIEKGIPTTERTVPKRKPLTSREITVQFSPKKLLIPGLVIIAIAIIGVFLWHPWSRIETPLEQIDKPSVAVLPFEDFSPQKDQEHLCNGIVDSVISSLSNLKDLRVPARGSPSLYKKGERDYKEIGELLNVDFVLDGTLQKSGDTLRITPRLINVADESILWSEKFDKEMQDIFTIQDEISLAIVDKLKGELLREERSKLTKRYTESIEAYNLYLKGRFFWNKRTIDGFKKAIEYFEQSIKKDPSYALAYSGLADCYNMLGEYDYLPPKEAYPKAKEAAQKALSIDGTLAQAHTSLAYVLIAYELDLDGAKKRYEQAIKLNPNYGTAHQWYANCLSVLRRHDEAIAEARQAREQDPLSPIINRNVGNRLYYARQFDQAIEESLKALKMFPDFSPIHVTLGSSYLQKGMFSEAISELQKGNSTALLGYAYAVSGDQAKAQMILNDLKEKVKNKYVPANAIALIYIGLGDKDHAIEWLEKAYEERSIQFNLITDPIYDPLRLDSRFKSLLKKIGLE